MRFLVTNDDGIGAPGLQLLTQIASQFGDVTVVAPESEQSGISHRLTFERPLNICEKSEGIYGVDGTPADCVRVAIAKFGQNYDWVLSGINDGANLGVDVFYSGTVAAAREAFLLGIPSIAISQYRKKYAEPFDWNSQSSLVEQLFHEMVLGKPRPSRWINVNLPDRSSDKNATKIEFVECETDLSPLPISYIDVADGMELRFRYSERPRSPGQDLDVCFGGNVSVSQQPPKTSNGDRSISDQIQ